jgi:hypothetical protein
MPSPAAIFVKAVLLILVAVALFQFAKQVGTVEVTVLADGEMNRSVVSRSDPAYAEETDRARKHAMPIYGLSALMGLIGLSLVRKSYRVYRKTRTA